MSLRASPVESAKMGPAAAGMSARDSVLEVGPRDGVWGLALQRQTMALLEEAEGAQQLPGVSVRSGRLELRQPGVVAVGIIWHWQRCEPRALPRAEQEDACCCACSCRRAATTARPAGSPLVGRLLQEARRRQLWHGLLGGAPTTHADTRWRRSGGARRCAARGNCELPLRGVQPRSPRRGGRRRRVAGSRWNV